MKNNFSPEELAKIIERVGSKMKISVNRAGNVRLDNPNEPEKKIMMFNKYPVSKGKGYWVLHKKDSVFYIYHRDGNRAGHGYLLNTGGRTKTGDYYLSYYDIFGRAHRVARYDFDRNNANFKTLDDALDYFMNYIKKYRNIN